MNNQEQLIRRLQISLDQIASKKTKEWWEQYLRNAILFRGVGIPEIRERLAKWRLEYNIATWDKQEQLSIALTLFESRIAEDKLAGILFLQNYLYDQFNWEDLLPEYAQLYLKGLIFDWNTCDWFCVRVLGPTIAKNGLPCAEAILPWNRADNLWQARSSVVAFVPVSADSRYYPLIYQSCHWLIQREERFAKTGVGWILRDLSRYDRDAVFEFVMSHLASFSIEAIKNALKYFPDDQRKMVLQKFKQT